MNEYYKAHKRQRKTWGISPVEKVVTSKKEYDRQEAKKEVQELIEEELDAYDFDVEWYNDPIDNNEEQ